MKTTLGAKVKKASKITIIILAALFVLFIIPSVIHSVFPTASADEKNVEDSYAVPEPAPEYVYPVAEMPQEIPTGAWKLQRMGSESMLVLESSNDRIVIELAGVNVSPDAMWFINKELDGKWLTLSFESETSIHDVNDRAYVYLPDGTLLQDTLIYRGMATVNTGDRSLIEHFTALEEAARLAKVGIWAN